jgi:hypothetical protein
VLIVEEMKKVVLFTLIDVEVGKVMEVPLVVDEVVSLGVCVLTVLEMGKVMWVLSVADEVLGVVYKMWMGLVVKMVVICVKVKLGIRWGLDIAVGIAVLKVVLLIDVGMLMEVVFCVVVSEVVKIVCIVLMDVVCSGIVMVVKSFVVINEVVTWIKIDVDCIVVTMVG